MKVSIQIPTYNQERFIQRAIKSALMQDYPDLEVVVLDDCSTDNTFQVALNEKSPKLKVFRNEQNLGRASTYRKLLYELVSGEWVVNLDADDYFIDESFISRGIKQISENKNIVFYQACIIGKSDDHEFKFSHKLLKERTNGALDGGFYFMNFHENEFFGHLSSIYNVQKARKVGFYEFNNLNSDAESMLKLALHGKVFLDNPFVGIWSIHENNESGLGVKKNNDTIASFERIKNYSIPYIGSDQAEKWLKIALKTHKKSYMEQLAIQNFKKFLMEAFKAKYFTKRFFILVLKRALNKI